MFEVLACDEIGMSLTEHWAMLPASSVSGFYLHHPQSSYFNVGAVGDDQLQDLAQRDATDRATLERSMAGLKA